MPVPHVTGHETPSGDGAVTHCTTPAERRVASVKSQEMIWMVSERATQEIIGDSPKGRAKQKERTMAALGIMLIIVGAIIVWGVNAVVDGFDLQAIGYILMVGGAIALVVAAIRGVGWMSMSNRKTRTEQHVSSDGQHYVEQTETH
jgi:hypothetical protein